MLRVVVQICIIIITANNLKKKKPNPIQNGNANAQTKDKLLTAAPAGQLSQANIENNKKKIETDKLKEISNLCNGPQHICTINSYAYSFWPRCKLPDFNGN